MSSNVRQSVADPHPQDLINQARMKLNTIQTLLYYHDSTDVDVLKTKDFMDGLFFILEDIGDELGLALQKLE